MIYLKLVYKEIISSMSVSLLLTFSLALGLIGFASLGTFRSSAHNFLTHRSKNILGADVQFSARQFYVYKDIEQFTKKYLSDSISSDLLETYSMVSANKKTRLCLISFIDNNYPLYGGIKLTSGREINLSHPSDSSFHNTPVAWAYPELLTQLGLKIGDNIRIGKVDFLIIDTVEDDPSNVSAGTSMAPLIFLSRNHMEATGLIQKGSTYYHSMLFRIPENISSEKVADAAFNEISNNAIKVSTHKEASEQMGRLLAYIGDFLGLTSIVTLLLSSIGLSFLFKSYIKSKIKNIAIYASLGINRLKIVGLFFIQLATLSLMATCIAYLTTSYLLKFATGYFSEILPPELKLVLTPQVLPELIAISLGCAFFICLPQFYLILKVKAQQLFYSSEFNEAPSIKNNLLLLLPFILFIWSLSIYLSKSLVSSALLFVALGVIVGIGSLLFVATLKIAKKLIPEDNFTLFYILRTMTRNFGQSLIIFISLTVGLTLSHLIPTLQEGFSEELVSPTKSTIPSLFLFDIQEEQLHPLSTLMSTNNLPLNSSSPLVRARINKINGQEFSKGIRSSQTLTREQEREMRFRNRGFNLTYRENLFDSERIVDGAPFSEYTRNKHPLVSLEYRFAERLNIEVGDIVDFDIQGVSVEAEISSLRKIRWTTFQPNFFIQFEPGVLEEAPKTFLATLPPASHQQLSKLQNLVVESFPNISIIDVRRLVSKLNNINAQVALLLKALSYLSIAMGCVILMAIASNVISSREQEIQLLKIAGAKKKFLMNIVTFEFLFTSILSSFFSMIAALLLATGFNYVLFDAVSTKVPAVVVVQALAIPLVCSIFVYTYALNILRTRPQKLLNS